MSSFRKDLYSNIILSGGNTLFPGFGDRLQREVSRLAPSRVRSKIIAPPARMFAPWIGGSIIASLSSSFKQLWISKEQYEEIGPTVFNK